MVISISGPSSTGKTTTINEILKRGKLGKYEKIIVVNENIRKMFKEEFLSEVGSMENMMPKKEWALRWVKAVGKNEKKFIDEQISKYCEDKNTLIILDRCILDHFIYFLMHTIKYKLTFEEFFEIINEYSNSKCKIDKEDYLLVV